MKFKTRKESQAQYYHKNKEKLAKYHAKRYQKNKKKIEERKAKWKYNNKEKIAEHNRRYYNKNKNLINEWRRKYYQANKDKLREYSKQYREKNKKRIAKNNLKYRLKNKDKIAKWNLDYKILCVRYYTNGKIKCDCCGESNIRFLTMDHTQNNGNKHRKEIGHTNLYYWLVKNKFPKGFKVLCWNCNMGREKQSDKICPHEKPIPILNIPEHIISGCVKC